MKTKITLFALLITVLSFAQNGINYKAVIKDNFGNVVTNQPINIRFTILKGTTNIYQETQLPMTDGNGITIVNIGEGTVVSGTFAAIDWGNSNHFLKVEIDIAGGTAFINMGTTEFKSVPYALNVTGLEAIDEGNGIGWRLKGKNPDNFGPIGIGAVDLSDNYLNSNTAGATGEFSTALGADNTASGDFSTAMGIRAVASGISSISIGIGTKAEAFNSTALGQYNIGGGDPNLNSPTNPILEVGNGLNSDFSSNALTILNNGNMGIGTHTPSQNLEVKGKIKIGNDTNTDEIGTIRYNSVTQDFEGHNGFGYKSFTNKDLTYIAQNKSQLSTNIRNILTPIGVEATINESGLYLIFFKCTITNLSASLINGPSDIRITLWLERYYSNTSSYIDNVWQEAFQDIGNSEVQLRWRNQEQLSDFATFNLNEGTILRLNVMVEDNGIGNLTGNYFVNESEITAIKIKE